jgi:hypothetical protein
MKLDWLQSPQVRKQFLKSGDTLEALADKLGINPAGLMATASRFSDFARTGVDEDFHRGRTAMTCSTVTRGWALTTAWRQLLKALFIAAGHASSRS